MKVVVAGGGVAGCVSAMGLKKLGYEVILIHRPRSFEAYEGFSKRTVEALQRSGCNHALKTIGPLSLRSSVWNGISRDANSEYLTFRPDFDSALLHDAMDIGVVLKEGSVIGSIIGDEKGISVVYKTLQGEFTISGDAAIDARGRFTPFPTAYECGPKSYSLLHKIAIPYDIPSCTTLHSVNDGWVWQASLGNGVGYLQMTCAFEIAQSIHHYNDLVVLLESQEKDMWLLHDATAEGSLIRRDSYGKRHKNIVKGKIFQVGDAASSVDPLSGNGVFQSLSMATILPYVIHTVLVRNESDTGIASVFYKERVNDLFNRYSRTGRDFYRSEEKFNGDFWTQRRSWPLDDAAELTISIEEKAILNVPFIEPQRVVVTPNHPMGISFFEGIDIVPIVTELLSVPIEKRKNLLMNTLQGMSVPTLQKFLHWMYENRMM